MAINRFFKPVDYEYTPIPFQELVTLGKYYADERRQAEKDLAQYIKNANEFTSLISKDVDTYNKTAFNDLIKSYINQAASNPSVMKDMGWRSGLQAAMNAVDYGMLNKLKSSAESAKVYNAAVQKLAMEGKMPPGWEPNYFDTYSTEQSGVFNATPLAYESMTDRVKPYLDNIKDSYLYTQGSYDYYGVDPSTIAKLIEVFKSDILRNPSNQRDIQKYMSMGMSLEDATNTVLTLANTAGMEFARLNRKINPISEINQKASAAAAKAGLGGRGAGNQFWFTQSMTADANIKANNVADMYFRTVYPDKYKAWTDAITAGKSPNATAEQKAAAKKATDELKALRKNVSDADIRKTIYSGGEQIDFSQPVTTSDAVNGSSVFFQTYSSPLGGAYNEKLTDMIQGVSDKYEDNKRVVTGTNNLTIMPVGVTRIVGGNVDQDSPLTALNYALLSGKLGKIKISGAGGIMAFPNGDNSINYGYNNIEVTEDALINANIFSLVNDQDVENFKNNKRGLDNLKKDRLRALMNQLGASFNEGEIHGSQSTTNKGSNKTVTTTVNKPINTYSFQVMYDLPSTHGGVSAEMLNTSMALEQRSRDQVGKEQAYNFILSNIQ